MTMINPYGIGAGKAISEQYEGSTDKEKKEIRKRLTAAQIAEQERLKARLQQRSTEYAEPNQLQQSSELRTNTLGTLRKPPTFRPQPSEVLADEETIAESDRLAWQVHPTGPRTPALGSTSIDTDARHIGERSDAVRGERLIGSLLLDIGSSPAKLTRERALSHLNSLNDALRSGRRGELSAGDSEGVLGYLEFLEGYFESTAKNAGHSEKIANLMSEIRIQLNLVADPGRAGVVQHEAMANQIRQPADPIPAVRSREHHKVSKRGRVGTDDDNEVDDVRHQQAESIVPPPPSVMQSGGSASQASLGNDSSRKREETLISVTLRSV